MPTGQRPGCLAGWWRRCGSHGAVWRARDRLAMTLAEVPPHLRLAFGGVVPEIDSILDDELPRLEAEARFLRRYLSRVDAADLRQEVRRWERSVYAATDPELREVRERNLELAREHLMRVERLQAALARYQDQVSGLALAIDEMASRVAASRLEEPAEVEPELTRLRDDIGQMVAELAELSAGL